MLNQNAQSHGNLTVIHGGDTVDCMISSQVVEMLKYVGKLDKAAFTVKPPQLHFTAIA